MPVMETEQAGREAFVLHEAVSLREAAVQSDDTVELIVIRPTIGRGKGRHLYEADMLSSNAHKFAGWKMYVDHESEEARRKAGGLPRSIHDLGGRVLESWWDPSVPAEGPFGAGAVKAKVRPTRVIRELIADDPELVEASINARATGVRPVVRDGKKAWLVEGIEDRGTIDWVTEAGAGGRVASLLEAVYHDDHAEENALLDSLTDEELVRKLRTERPELIEALAGSEQPDGDDLDNGADEHHEESGDDRYEGGAVADPVEALREALASEEGLLLVREIVESAFADERDLIRAEARADADRVIQLHTMERDAHRMIEAAKLPERWESRLKDEFSLTEAGPSDGLDIVDEIDEGGAVVTPAEDILRESVGSAISQARELMTASQPTRVRGQGGSSSNGDSTPQKNSLWRKQLQEAGFDNPDEAYSQED